MKTLPPEIQEIIVRKLSPQDLISCSRVCREWREVFNRDWIWKPLCDPELAETLRTTPCVAKPLFEIPEAEHSTLSPVSYWKSAYMRETRFWKNWRKEEISFANLSLGKVWKQRFFDNDENIVKFEKEHIIRVDFFTDNSVIVWGSNYIEILDVSVIPAVVIAKTHEQISITNEDKLRVIGSEILLVEIECSVARVFFVDCTNKSITFQHNLKLKLPDVRASSPRPPINYRYFDEIRPCSPQIAKGNYLCLNKDCNKLMIFDIKSGVMVREERIPLSDDAPVIKHAKIITSPTSDFIAVEMKFQPVSVYDPTSSEVNKYYIYNLNQFTFSSEPVVECGKLCYIQAILHDHWFVVTNKTLKIINLQNDETCVVDFRYCGHIGQCNDNFVFICKVKQCKEKWLKMFNPSQKIWTSICRISNSRFEVVHNKFIASFKWGSHISDRVWKVSGQIAKTSNLFFISGTEVNRSFTKVLIKRNKFERHTLCSIDELISMKESEFHVIYLW